MKQVNVSVTLLSDLIPGSGYSIPGGEDIAVLCNEDGTPYLKGSTFKGVLQESMEQYLTWNTMSIDCISSLFGEGRRTTASLRRLIISDLTVQRPPHQDCTYYRTFTKIASSGIAEEGTLRVAACVRRGLTMTGTIYCAEEDVELVCNTLKCVKQMGTLRNRGFGQVKCSGTPESVTTEGWIVQGTGNYLCYQLLLRDPVRVTNLDESHNTGYETRLSIPGTTMRGMVLNRLATQNSAFFEANKRDLLTQIRFLDAVPLLEERGGAIPSPRCFYEDKQGNHFESVLEGEVIPGNKRAGVGAFCTIADQILSSWTPKTASTQRINLKMIQDPNQKGGIFQNRWLSAGQMVEGYIRVPDSLAGQEELINAIAKIMYTPLWLGAGKFAGCGTCEVRSLERVVQPTYFQYGYRAQESVSHALYLLLLSPTGMRDRNGATCGMDFEALEKQLKCRIKTEHIRCATKTVEISGFNTTLRTRLPKVLMYDSGSIFKLPLEGVVSGAQLLQLQQTGLGMRTAEGFGQVLFLKDFEQIGKKEVLEHRPSTIRTQTVQFELARAEWLEKEYHNVPKILSKSQLGTLQDQCRDALWNGGRGRLDQYFNHIFFTVDANGKRKARDPKKTGQYQRIYHYLEMFFQQDTSMLGDNSEAFKLGLFCDLITTVRRSVQVGGDHA